MHKYRVFGLNVLTNISLNCYPLNFESEDIIIIFTNSETQAKSYISQRCRDSNYKRFQIENSRSELFFYGDSELVVYYDDENYLNNFLIHSFLGFAFMYFLLNKKLFLLHGSSIAINDMATVFIGDSGAGKSTLAGAMVQQGGFILSDDTTRLEMNVDTPFIYPSFPIRRLHRNTAQHLKINMDGAVRLINEEDKFSFSDVQQNVFLNQNTPVKAIVHLALTDKSGVKLVRENISNSIITICRNIYYYQYLCKSEYAGDCLDYALRICDRIPVYTLYRPRNIMTVEDQVRVILAEIYG